MIKMMIIKVIKVTVAIKAKKEKIVISMKKKKKMIIVIAKEMIIKVKMNKLLNIK